jgi:ketosteroid isomerase-like protein
MDDLAQIEALAHAIAAAIQAKDDRALLSFLAPDFVLRRPGASPLGAAEFVAAVRDISVELSFVRIEELAIDLAGESALATGMQHSQVRVKGELIDSRQPFIDWFVKRDGSWQLHVALDLSED